MRRLGRIVTVIALGVVLAVGFGGQTAVRAARAESAAPKVSAASAYAIDYDTGSVVFEHNAAARRPIASMCKIMTLLLAFESIDAGKLSYSDMLTVSETAAGMGGSQAFLDANSAYSADELLRSIVVASANDSCVAVAEHLAGSVDGFVARMNARAAELGMADTNFVNCTGLPAPNHYSTARDVAVMMRALAAHGKYYEYAGVWMHDLVHPSGRVTGLTNTNRMIRTYRGCDGGKTGYTAEAGSCVASTAKRDGMRLITVVMGEADSKTRFADVAKIFNYGFANFGIQRVASAGDVIASVAVCGGKQREIPAIVTRDVGVFGTKGAGEVTIRIETFDVQAPVAAGARVGTLYVARDGVVVAEVELAAGCDAARKGYADYLRDVAEKF